MVSIRFTINKLKIAKRFLTLIVCLGCLLGTPCSSRPIAPLGDLSAGVEEKPNNASTVVRIIVSSSSSSSSGDSDFSHFFPISTNTTTATTTTSTANSTTDENETGDPDDLHEFNGTRNRIRTSPRNSIKNNNNIHFVDSQSLSSQSFFHAIDHTTTSHSSSPLPPHSSSSNSGQEPINTNIGTNSYTNENLNQNQINKSTTFTSNDFTSARVSPTTSESNLAVTPSTIMQAKSIHPIAATLSLSPSSKSTSNFKPLFLSSLPSTPNPVPTTYRPKSFRFRSSPLFLSLFLSSTTTTTTTSTTTIKPLPFREDIFSIFYRAFAESQDTIQHSNSMSAGRSHSNPSPSSQPSSSSSLTASFINNLQSHNHKQNMNIPKTNDQNNNNHNHNNYETPFDSRLQLRNQHQHQQPHQLLPSETIKVGSSARNVESFQILPSPRIVQSSSRDKNPYKNINSNVGSSLNDNNDKLNAQEQQQTSQNDKIVTAVVTRSSSSSVSASGTGTGTTGTGFNSGSVTPINVNYPRIRPSSVMMLRLRDSSNFNPCTEEKENASINNKNSKENNVTSFLIETLTNSNPLHNTENENDTAEDENPEAEAEHQHYFQQQAAENENASGVADWSSKEKHVRKDWQALNIHSGSESENPTEFLVVQSTTDKIINYNSHNNDYPNHNTNFPKAEALIQSPDKNNDAVNSQSQSKSTREDEIHKTQSTTTTTHWQIPEKNWSEPAKIWSEPSKVWSEPAKVWGQPSKVWSEAPTTTPRIQVNSSFDAKQIEDENQSVTKDKDDGQDNKTDGQTDDDLADDDIDDEEIPQGTFFVLGDDEDEESPPSKIPDEFSTKSSSSSSWELPELTPQVDHSFVEPVPPSASAVQDSIERALRRQSQSQKMDFRFSSNSNSNTNLETASRTRTTMLPFSMGNKMNSNSKARTQILSQHQRHNNQNYRHEYNNEYSRNQNQNMQLPLSSSHNNNEERESSGKKFGYVLDGNDVRKYRVEERTSDGYIVGEYGVLNNNNGFLRGVRYTADGTINPRLIHEALMKFLSL